MAAVAVVGAGVAGLTAAYRLKRLGIRVVVYESSDRAGGVILTERREGYLAELGPNSLTPSGPARSRRSSAARPRRYRGSKRSARPASATSCASPSWSRLPTSPSQLLTTRLLSNGAKLAIFGEPHGGAGRFADGGERRHVRAAAIQPGSAGLRRQSVRRRHLRGRSRAALRPPCAAPAARPGAHPRLGDEGAGADDAKEGRRGPARDPGPISFAGGLQEIPDALARELRSEIRFKAPVTQIRRGPKGWTVSAAYQASELYDGVIYTAPAHCADEIELEFEGGDRLKTLTSITHPPVAVLALGFRREDVAHKLDGFGLLVPEVERRNVLGVDLLLHHLSGRAPAGHVLLTAFVGGVRNPDLANADLSTLTARVLDDLRLLLGVRGEPTFRAFHLWPKAIPQYTLSYGRFKEIMDDAERRNPGLGLDRLVPRRRRAGRRHRRGGPGRGADRGAGRHGRAGGGPVSAGRALRVGTRGSALALWQTERIRELLGAAGRPTERVEIRTTGDLVQDVPLARIGSLALFTRQIDEAMLAGRIDIAVHSLKDLPTPLPRGDRHRGDRRAGGSERRAGGRGARSGGATCRRAPRSRPAACGAGRSCCTPARPPGAGHPRQRGHPARQARRQARRGRPSCSRPPACCGWGSAIASASGCRPEVMLPAPGQGALAVTARADDAEAIAAVRAAVHHRADGARGERRAGVSPAAGGRVPGAGGGAGGARGRARRAAAARQGDLARRQPRRRGTSGRAGAGTGGSGALGTALAERLLAEGAAAILAEVRAAVAPAVSEP